MPKQPQNSQTEIKKILNFAQHLRTKVIIPSLQLQNFLNFQYSQIVQQSGFSCCSIEKTSIDKSFKRAFRTMTRAEQANYYSNCVKIVLKQIYSINNKAEELGKFQEETNTDNHHNQRKFEQLSVLVKKQGSFKKWVICKIQIASEICVMRLIQSGEQLDLHHYILRQSSSQKKPSLVLESTDQLARPITLRITDYNQPFKDLKYKLQFYIDKALRFKIFHLLKKNRTSFSTSFRSSIQGQIFMSRQILLHKKQSKSKSLKYPQQNDSLPATIRFVQGKQAKSMRNIIRQSSKLSITPYQCKKIYSKLISHQKIFSLSSMKNFDQISDGIFHNKKTHVTRRVFRFEQSQMSYEWLVTSMNCYKTFKKWKSCLFLINLLAEFPQEKTKIYHQINLYKDYNEVDYIFLRHLFEIDGINYYVDKSVHTEQYNRVANGSRGWIEQCVWRFRKCGSMIELLVQIEFGGNYSKKNALQMAIQYIGDVGELARDFKLNQNRHSQNLKTVYNQNLFLFQDQSEFNGTNSQINSPSKPDRRLSRMQSKQLGGNRESKSQNPLKQNQKATQLVKISKLNIQYPAFLDQLNLEGEHKKQESHQNQPNQYNQQTNFCGTQYFSIDGSNSQSDQELQQVEQHCEHHQLVKQVKKQSDLQINNSFEIQSIETQIYPSLNLNNHSEITKYLRILHIVQCKEKDDKTQIRQSTSQKGHFFWRKQWKITQKGQLININQQQIKAQSSVLKLVIKRMGRNILSGKSVLNVSLPIEIFGVDSNLERLCKSMGYGPKFLEDAVKLQSPLQRMKKVICFALGYSLSYIEMQKPFNPILGETYQGVIDGCPVYGQQISHHPPISTVLFKGRGYTVYANLQAKVDMGLNSASGINQGIINVSFSQNNYNQNVIKFNGPPGELSGLVMGDRKLTLTKKTYYIDQKNMIFAFIQWGSQKKKNDISFNNDYFEGQVVQLKPNTDLTKLDKIKQNQFEKVLSQIKGRWTGKVCFDNQVMFDIETDGPYQVQQLPYLLKSNVQFREDIIERRKNDMITAQQAKERLEEIQRNDRKLRKQYQKK